MNRDRFRESFFSYDKERKLYKSKASEALMPSKLADWPGEILLEMDNGTGTFTFRREKVCKRGVRWVSTIGSRRRIVILNDFN